MAQKQVQDAYIVAATRTPIGRSGRGYFKNTRPDDLLVAAIKSAMLQVPTLDPKAIEDAIIGCSFPEGEQGMNMARIAVGLAFDHPVGGVTVNRFCASGITALQMAADRIRVGEADVLIAGGAESMSLVPMGGNKPSFNAEIFAKDENVGIAYGMGLTAEKVAQQWKVSREAQDAFALESHLRAIKAQKAGALIVASEKAVKQFGLTPLARFVSYAARGVPPEIMGIGPIEAIPAALRYAGLKSDDIGWYELNEAFAAQSLAVINTLGLNPANVNPMGGAIALGHPLGATGAIRAATVVHALRRHKLKYGMVTMCVGTGQGAAGIIEAL